MDGRAEALLGRLRIKVTLSLQRPLASFAELESLRELSVIRLDERWVAVLRHESGLSLRGEISASGPGVIVRIAKGYSYE